MTKIKIEAIGGFVGYGESSHVRTRGEVDLEQLDAGERQAVEQLLGRAAEDASSPGPHYRLSWDEDGQARQAEVGEADLTPTMRASLKTDLI